MDPLVPAHKPATALPLDDKTFSTYQAKFALARSRLLRVPDGYGEVYLVIRGALMKEIKADEVEGFLQRMTGERRD